MLVDRKGERANGAGEKMTVEGAEAYKPSLFRNLAMRRFTPGSVSRHSLLLPTPRWLRWLSLAAGPRTLPSARLHLAAASRACAPPHRLVAGAPQR